MKEFSLICRYCKKIAGVHGVQPPNNIKRLPRQRYSTLEANDAGSNDAGSNFFLEQANAVNAMQNATFNPDEWVVRADSFPDDEESKNFLVLSTAEI